MTTTTRNEAADALRRWISANDIYHSGMGRVFDEALAAERRATVERIRERLLLGAFIPPGIGNPYLEGIVAARNGLLVILDEEAQR